jgi:hypothetical protein
MALLRDSERVRSEFKILIDLENLKKDEELKNKI